MAVLLEGNTHLDELKLLLPEKKALLVFNKGMSLDTPTETELFFAKAKEYARSKDIGVWHSITHQLRNPTDVQEFIESPAYMNAKGAVWPKVMYYIQDICAGDYTETVLTGSIGCAKTTIALWLQAYQLYLLSCYVNPQAMFGLDPNSEILIIFQSLNKSIAKALDYGRFRSMVENSTYFNRVYPYTPDIQSELIFPNRVIIRPISGASTGAIGQNVIGGLIDELNYMAVVENSKNVSADSGTYDQAVSNYNSIARRRKSRFLQAGKLPGILCLVSSKRYPGQFTDIKEEEQRRDLIETGKSLIYVYDKCSWDIAPKGKYIGEMFNVFVGDSNTQPRILKDGEIEELSLVERELVKEIPIEHRSEFETDIMDALREVAGVSTLAQHPFFTNRESVAAAFGKNDSVLSKTRCTLMPSDKIQAYANFKNKISPRFAHIDLAITGDCAGVVIGHVNRFIEIRRGEGYELWPEYVIDCVLEVPHPPGGEILFHRIRDLLYILRDSMGMPIKWVTYDSFQSRDSIQILRQKGFTSGIQSMDTSTEPYMFLKAALYEGRVLIPYNEKLQKELNTLEYFPQKKKIDHPPKGSKDLSDSLAGVVYGLVMRREVWAHHRIDPVVMRSFAANKTVREAKENEKVAEKPLIMFE